MSKKIGLQALLILTSIVLLIALQSVGVQTAVLLKEIKTQTAVLQEHQRLLQQQQTVFNRMFEVQEKHWTMFHPGEGEAMIRHNHKKSENSGLGLPKARYVNHL